MPEHVCVREVLSPQEPGVFTDHGVVCFEFRASTNAQHKVNRTVYDYRKGDFEGLRRALKSINICNLVRDSGNINLVWAEWKHVFMSAVSEYIATKKIKGRKLKDESHRLRKLLPPVVTQNYNLRKARNFNVISKTKRTRKSFVNFHALSSYA